MSEEPSLTERRFGPRRVTDVKTFAHDGVELRKCTLRDIGLQGAFVETKNFPLAEGAETELVIRLNREGKRVHCRFPATVVRTESDGAALRFTELDPHAQEVLVELVYANDAQQTSKASY
ncbi:MAG: PilZ domain-containing protein [Acidiferrobacterales bacterium]